MLQQLKSLKTIATFVEYTCKRLIELTLGAGCLLKRLMHLTPSVEKAVHIFCLPLPPYRQRVNEEISEKPLVTFIRQCNSNENNSEKSFQRAEIPKGPNKLLLSRLSPCRGNVTKMSGRITDKALHGFLNDP